jgi:hypothetical protein
VIGKPDKRSRRAILAELSAGRGVCIDELDSLPAAADWGEWLDRLGALATRALRQPDRVLAVLAELAPMAPVAPVTLIEILIVLRPPPGNGRAAAVATLWQSLRRADRGSAGPQL